MTMGRWIVLTWAASGIIEVATASAGYLMQRQDWIGWAIAGAASLAVGTFAAIVVAISSPPDEDGNIEDETTTSRSCTANKTT